MNSKISTRYFVGMLISLAIISRLFPHPPDFTPMLALSLWLARYFSVLKSSLIILLSLFISDQLLAYWFGLPFIGQWMWFTYSGFLLITFYSRYVSGDFLQAFLVSFYFWAWTNFGVWLTSHMYPLTAQGLLNCFTLALPFLLNTVVGTFVWWFVFCRLTSSGNVFNVAPHFYKY